MIPGPIVFFGTPEFAVPTLDALIEAGMAPVAVVSQPSRPAGRGRGLRRPPVAERAAVLGAPLLQPESVAAPDFLDTLDRLEPAVAVVVAFGQIFPGPLLGLPRHGCVNVHASLLPRWRGAAPIQAAIAAGEERSGVSIMRMEEGLDTGPVLLQRDTAIAADETAPELAARLAELGAGALVDALKGLGDGSIEARPQDNALATYAPRITRGDGRVDWNLPARCLYDRWRAFQPWPGLHAELDRRPVKLVEVRRLGAAPVGSAEGAFLGLQDSALAVACGDGELLGIDRLQRPGGRALAAADFANGERLSPPARFR